MREVHCPKCLQLDLEFVTVTVQGCREAAQPLFDGCETSARFEVGEPLWPLASKTVMICAMIATRDTLFSKTSS